jgi:hypothetical protein
VDDLLDLAITLRPPGAGSRPDVLATIEVRFDAQGLTTQTDDTLIDPLTSQERADLRWYLEDYWKWPFEAFADRAHSIESRLLPDIGKRLYRAVFGSIGANSILQAWRLQPSRRRQISILSALPRALSLPWELLHDEQGFLVLRNQPVSIFRRLPQTESAGLPTAFAPPLRVLLVTARPEAAGFVDPRLVARELLDEIQGQVEQGAMELECLRPPTLAALANRLADVDRPVHVLHFDGHGTFADGQAAGDSQTQGGGQGKLAFENETGGLDLVAADDLAQVLQSSGVRLVVLNACQSAQGSADDIFSSVAARLIKGGTDAVVAMSATVLVATAVRYAKAFYHALAAGIPAPIAHEQGRKALHTDLRRHPFRRGQDEEGEPVKLRDWWLPHYYQQRLLTLRPVASPEIIPPQPVLLSGLPEPPRYGFAGRCRELLFIERTLLKKKVVVLHGFGGIGKTALATEAANWLTKAGMYRGACFVSCEGGGDAAKILSTLGAHLEIDTDDFSPADPKTALPKIASAVREQSTLVVVDNALLFVSYPGGPRHSFGDPWLGRRHTWLLYIKATITGDEPADVLNYAALHPDFPYETTLDQVFDEPQWESYRRLGEHIGDNLFV